MKTSAAVSDCLSVELVKVGMESADKEEAFEELVDLLVRAGKVHDRARAIAAIHEREGQQSTGIGDGVAIPHGKDESIKQLLCALGMSPGGIEFDALDGRKAHVIFLVLAEAHNPGPHVALLAGISCLLGRPGFIRKLREAASGEQALAVIREAEEETEGL
ncbi:MAG: PTS sugar transporter subunit IIA [Planctomycetota bacterium]